MPVGIDATTLRKPKQLPTFGDDAHLRRVLPQGNARSWMCRAEELAFHLSCFENPRPQTKSSEPLN